MSTPQFPLVILDLDLPDGSGLNRLPVLRSVSKAPVVVCSAQEICLDFCREGIQAAWVKAPTSHPEIPRTIQALVSPTAAPPWGVPCEHLSPGGG